MRVNKANNNNIKPNNYVRPINLLLWLLFVPVFLLPLCLSRKAFAETAATTFSVGVDTTLTVTLSSSSTSLTILPTTGGQFGRTSVTVNVATNNAWGYSLAIMANTNKLTRQGQVNGITYTIDPLVNSITCSNETATSCSAFPSNYWGYKVGNSSTYAAMPTSAKEINRNDSHSTATQPTTVYFGAKLNETKPTGVYDGVTVNFIATTNSAPTSITDLTYLQDFASLSNSEKNVIINSMTTEQSYTLKDKRDNNSYSVAKLKDGKVWLLDNLRLGGTTSKLLTPSDTNITNNFTLPASGTSNFYYDDSGYMMPAVNTTNANTTASYPNNYTSPIGKIGAYYNYCAASGGTYCYKEGEEGFKDAEYDICPAGWRMPKGGEDDENDNEYNNLYRTYNSNYTNFFNALHIPLSGYIDDGLIEEQDSLGYFWSSTYYGRGHIYVMYVTKTRGSFNWDNNRYYGSSIRCVTR